MIQRVYHNNNQTAYFYHRRFKSLLLARQAVPLTDDYWAQYFFNLTKKKTLNKKSMVGYVGLDQVRRHCGALSTVKNFFSKFIKY